VGRVSRPFAQRNTYRAAKGSATTIEYGLKNRATHIDAADELYNKYSSRDQSKYSSRSPNHVQSNSYISYYPFVTSTQAGPEKKLPAAPCNHMTAFYIFSNEATPTTIMAIPHTHTAANTRFGPGWRENPSIC
jgi:hypothetical protein